MMISFKEFLLENTMQKTKLSIFDYDGTLSPTPERPKTGVYSTVKDWWGSEESLSHPLYNGKLHDEVADAFRKAKSDSQTHTIVLTGRRGIISHKVRETLRNHGLYGKRIIAPSNKDEHNRFKDSVKKGKDIIHDNENSSDAHHEYYTGDFYTEPDYPRNSKGKIDSGTWTHKMYVVRRLMNQNIQEVDFWDDRSEHIPNWKKLGVMLLNEYPNITRITLHRVYNYADIPPFIEHIPIKKDMQW